MGLRLPNLDYVSILGGIGDNLVNAYDKYQAPKLLEQAMLMQNGGVAPSAAALGGQSVPTSSPSTPQGQPSGGFSQAVQRTLGFEGGLNPRDTNGTPSNMGINAAANPDVNVASLTKDQATDIYKKRYWDAINGDQLSKVNPALAYAGFDTAVIAGPGKAMELIKQSGGDPNALLALRKQFQDSLIAADPEKYGKYEKAWNNRIAGLQQDVANMGGGQGAAPPANQVADASGIVVPPSAGASRGVNYSPQMIQRLMQNPYTKSIGTALMQAQIAGMAGKPEFKQFGNTIYRQGPDGSLAPVGNIPKDPQILTVPVTDKDGNVTGYQQREYVPGRGLGNPIGPVDTAKAPEEFKNLITPEERMAAGIPADYKGVVQQNSKGQLSFPGKPGTEVNVNNSAETKQAQELGGAKGEVFSNYIKAYDGAHEKMNALNAMQNFINSNPNMYMGAGADSVLATKKFAKGVGEALKIPGLENIDVSSQEGIEKFGRQLAGAAAKTVGGSRVTNFELDQFIKANPGLLTTREGNTRLIGIMQQIAQREMALSNLAADYTDKNPGASLSGFRAQIKEYDKANPIKDVDGTVLSGDAVKPSQGSAPVSKNGQRAPLPQGYTAAKAVNEARQALSTLSANDPRRQAIKDRLKSFGIDPANAGD